MEQNLIKQLLSNGLSIKKIKDIVNNLDEPEEDKDLNKTVLANTCGLRLIKCGGCHKQLYEDKFMSNRLNKRYRSCIECIMRQRSYRQKQDNTINNDISLKNENKDNDKILAILDKEYNDEETNNNNDNDNNNNNNNIYPFPYPIEKKEDIIVKPSNDKPNDDLVGYDIFEIIERNKAKKNITSKENHKSVEPETEPEEVGLRFFKLFN